MRAWHSAAEKLLDDIRCGSEHRHAEENLTEAELKAVKKYAAALLAFTEAQNKGLSGFGLHHQNEMREHLPEDTAVNLLGYALVQVRDMTAKLENAIAAVAKAKDL